MIKHHTASTFVFGRFPEGWRVALIDHPRLGRPMMPGGHVEADENQEEAARREVVEETGLAVRFVPAVATAVPAGVEEVIVPPPWWVVEVDTPPDGSLDVDHVHVDHVYVAVADSTEPASPPAHPFTWYRPDELPALDLFDDLRIFATTLFAHTDRFT